MRRSARLFIALAAATLAISWAGQSLATDSQAWAACQGQNAPVDLDQLIDQCATAAGCQSQNAPPNLGQIIAGCTAVLQSPGEPALRRALAGYQLGVTNALAGNQSAAISAFDEAISVAPGFAEAIERRGAAYAARGDDPHALIDYNKAIQLRPNLAKAYLERAQVYYRAHDYDRAIADITRFLAYKPNDPVGLNDRCWIRAASGRDLTAALQDCDQAVTLMHASALPLDSRGFTHLRMKNFAGAIVDYDASLAVAGAANSIRASSLYGRGLARIASNNVVAGRADLAAAQAADPSIAKTYAALGLKP